MQIIIFNYRSHLFIKLFNVIIMLLLFNLIIIVLLFNVIVMPLLFNHLIKNNNFLNKVSMQN